MMTTLEPLPLLPLQPAQPLPTSRTITTQAASLATPPDAVSFDSVTRRFGSTTALENVDVSIPIGSTVALLGPNGAGKSTAINLMLGLLHASSGSVRTLGLAPREAVSAGRIGAMLQDGGLPTGCLVGELVDFARRLYPQPLTLQDALRTARLDALATRRVEALSGGEMQRLRFALAIAGDPDLVFLDEPTVAMDVETRHAFWIDMRRFAAEGRTVLFATHYLEEAGQVADRIVVLDHGRIVADGTPGSIKAATSERTVRFTLPEADRGRLETFPGVTACELRGSGVTLSTSDADATVGALYAARLPIRDLEVAGATLESAFLAIIAGEREG
jgi:ABC-2 type transport system ATP-binding protein